LPSLLFGSPLLPISYSQPGERHDQPTSAPPQAPRLLDLVRQAARTRFGQDGPGERHADWCRRFILFHGKRHPREMGLTEVAQFLESAAL
jgi:hypothetical protein